MHTIVLLSDWSIFFKVYLPLFELGLFSPNEIFWTKANPQLKAQVTTL